MYRKLLFESHEVTRKTSALMCSLCSFNVLLAPYRFIFVLSKYLGTWILQSFCFDDICRFDFIWRERGRLFCKESHEYKSTLGIWSLNTVRVTFFFMESGLEGQADLLPLCQQKYICSWAELLKKQSSSGKHGRCTACHVRSGHWGACHGIAVRTATEGYFSFPVLTWNKDSICAWSSSSV